jgi:YjbE family integral membrane protein
MTPAELLSSLTALLPTLTVLLQVLFIDVVLAGDNAVVVGLAVAGLPKPLRRRAILFGIGAATVIRIGLAAVTFQLLAIIGMTLAGGLLLLWVCWKMFRELHRSWTHPLEPRKPKTLAAALTQIALADVSMSLDNVLAVAGAATGHPWVLVIGLGISVVLMGAAAGLIANQLERHRWIAWVGLLIVLSVAVRLIWEGSHQVAAAIH